MCKNLRIWIACLLVAWALPLSSGIAQRAGVQPKKPSIEKPNKAGDVEDDKDKEDDDDDEKPTGRTGNKDDDDAEPAAGGANTINDASAADEGKDGIPPLPLRAPPVAQRGVVRSTEPFGPVVPPPKWADAEIADAKSACARLLPETGYEFKTLEPIKDGACGAPAPIRLAFINDVPRVEVRPGATMTCPLAEALDRWLREVVQPSAKTLLHANVIRLGNLAAYQCRNRYNSATERISYHAYAEALDVSEFVTAKGEHINVLEHWPVKDERSQFLREVHDGACKIFGTVLGPEANEAHRNHFHFDLAKRRHSAYCQ